MDLDIVLNIDCIEGMQKLPDKSIDMILCDLPYGTTALDWDTIIPLDLLWKQYERIIKDNRAIVLTASQPFTSVLVTSNIKLFKHEWIWVKNTSSGMMNAGKSPMKRHESILVFGKEKVLFNPQKILGSETSQNHSKKKYSYKNYSSKLYNVDGNVPYVWSEFVNPHSVLPCNSVGNRDKDKIHPTQKPIPLFEYLIKTYTNENDIVLDNCCGSGTTGIACKNTKRSYILMDNGTNTNRKSKYYNRSWADIARERIEKY